MYDASREAEVSDLARQRAGSDMATRVDSLMKTMMRISREKQYDILIQTTKNWKMGQELATAGTTLEQIHKVSYGGTLGSYSEHEPHGNYSRHRHYYPRRPSSACERVLSGEVDAAVLPLENTIGGTVDNVYELLQKKNLHIVKATSVMVAHCLAVIPGTKLSDIKSVSSHPQGLAQCSK